MRILIVDDDYLQEEWAEVVLKKSFLNSKIEYIETEHEFQSRLNEIANDPPDVIIMDVMLRWTSPADDMPDWPEDVEKEGFYKAGFRCEKLLSDHEKLRNVPLIFYTVLERGDLEREYEFVSGSKTFLQQPGRAYLKKGPKRAFLRKAAEAESLVDLIRQLVKTH